MHCRTLIGALVTSLLMGGCAALDQQQRAPLFQPGDHHWRHARLEGMQERWIDYECPDTGQPVQLHGLWLEGPHPQAPVMLYLHGARWNVSGSTVRMHRLRELGFAVLNIDYRGFGKTRPHHLPSEASARADALAAWSWLRQQYPHRPRFVFGHSLGGAIAVDLAMRVDDEAGVMVENTFTSTREAARQFPWGWLPIGPFITQKFDSVRKVAHIGSPLLVAHGSEDAIIPSKLGAQLFEAAQQPKAWVLVPGANHHTTSAQGLAAYRQALQQLMPAYRHATAPSAAPAPLQRTQVTWQGTYPASITSP